MALTFRGIQTVHIFRTHVCLFTKKLERLASWTNVTDDALALSPFRNVLQRALFHRLVIATGSKSQERLWNFFQVPYMFWVSGMGLSFPDEEVVDACSVSWTRHDATLDHET